MALSEFELKRCERLLVAFVESRRPPAHLRSQLDIGFRITGHSMEIFEIRPQWDQPEITREHPVAKVKYVRTSSSWRLFWLRGDLKWHRYDPAPELRTLEEALRVIGEDEYGCFWG